MDELLANDGATLRRWLLERLPDWAPDAVAGFLLDADVWLLGLLAAVVALGALGGTLASLRIAFEGLRWGVGFVRRPRQALRETVRPVAPASRDDLAALEARIEAMLDARAADRGSDEAGQLDRSGRERRNAAVGDLVAEYTPAAEAATRALAEGDFAGAVATLRRDAEAANADAAERWRRLGDLSFGVDTAEALAAYEQAFALRPDDFWTCVTLSRLRREAGDLSAATDAADAAARHARDARERAIAASQQGDCLREGGDLRAAIEKFRDVAETMKHRAHQDPKSDKARRDLSVSLERLGDVLREGSDLKGARTAYKKSLKIAKRLAGETPGSDRARRDLSVSLERLGDVLRESGDLDGARARYQEGLEGRERLARENPGSAQARRDLSVSLNKLGDVLRETDDLDGARALYQEDLDIAERLARENPGSAEAERDVWVSLWKLAGLPGTGVTWRRVAERLEDMDARGVLAPRDRDHLEEARELAAAEDRG